MRRKSYLLFGVALISILVILPLVSSCAPEGAAPPSEEAEKYVTFLSLTDFTGAVAGLAASEEGVSKAYFDYLNDKGGIEGIKVKKIAVDTRYDAARAVSAYRRYRNEHKLVMINALGTHIGQAVAPLAEKDKIVVLVPNDGEPVAHPGFTFSWNSTYQDMLAVCLDWMVADWKAKGNAGMPTVGYYHWDNPHGREALKGGLEYAAKLGVNFLTPEFNPPGTVDHSVPLTRMAEGGANYIYIGGIDPNCTLVLKGAYDLGLTEKIQFISDIWGPTEAVGVRLYPEAVEGSIVVGPFLRGADARNHPMAKVVSEFGYPLSELTGPGLGLGVALFGMTMEAGIKKALEMGYSYEDLDSEAFYEAIQNATGYDRQGIAGPLAYSKTERRGDLEVKLYQFKNHKAVAITDWIRVPDAYKLYPDW